MLAPVAIASWRPGMAWSAKPGMFGGATNACDGSQKVCSVMQDFDTLLNELHIATVYAVMATHDTLLD